MRNVAAVHRRINRQWYRTAVKVERSVGEAWIPVSPQLLCNIQYRFAFTSSADPDVASPRDAEVAMMFCDPSSDIRTGDRITILGTSTVWSAVAVNSERTDAGTMAVTMAKAQTAVAGETITFRRHAGAGAFTAIGTFTVQFTEQPTAVMRGRTATGQTISGVMIAGPEAAVVISGDYFDRDGAPGRVQDIDRDPVTGRIELAYIVEGS